MIEDELKKVFSYDPETGIIVWNVKTNSRNYVGKEAGCIYKDGYKYVKFKGGRYKCHRLAWLLYYGRWPIGQIDHVKNKYNNIKNLRESTHSQNMHNKKGCGYLGLKGVTKNNKGFIARIGTGNERVYLGHYPTAELAAYAYNSAALLRYGEFCYGRLAR